MDNLNENNSGGEGKIICYQINLHKSSDAAVEHCKVLKIREDSNYKISFIQEPHIIKNTVKGFTDLNVFQYIGTEKVRAAIVTSPNIVSWPLLQFCTGDQAVISFRS